MHPYKEQFWQIAPQGLCEGEMALRALPISSSHNWCPPNRGFTSTTEALRPNRTVIKYVRILAKAAEKDGGEDDEEEGQTKSKQSLLGGLIDALDFSQVRSSQDAELLEDAREATKSGGKMNREQYGALRRKIGGTYQDFFKSYVDVDGEYVEEGWVDKTCKICKKDTKGEPRQVDNLGRYVHVGCIESKKSGNFFTNLFSK